MSRVLHHKFVASLPATLEADSIYFVRVGSGYDQYVTNHSGQIVAYPMNRPAYLPAYLQGQTLLKVAINASTMTVSVGLKAGGSLAVGVANG